MKEVVRVDQEVIDSVLLFIRKQECSDKKEVIEMIKGMQKYPLIRMDNVVEKLGEEMEHILEDKGEKEVKGFGDKTFSIGKMCFYKPFFPKCTYYYTVPIFSGGINVMVLLHIDLNSRRGKLLFKINGLENNYRDMCGGILPIVIQEETFDDTTVVIDPDYDLFKSRGNMSYDMSLAVIDVHLKKGGITISNIFASITGTVMMALGDLHIHNYYPFQVGGNRHGEGGEVIYLNKIPTHSSQRNELSTGDTKEPHMRRGTWWTMRAERYKEHPNYMCENANYRQAAWIGPKEFRHKGKTYKILFHKDEAVS